VNSTLLLLGLAKAAFGIVVGAAGIWAASRALQRLLGMGTADAKEGHLAFGVLTAAMLVALGILLQHPVGATFNAMDLMFRDHPVTMDGVRRIATYAALHLGVSIAVSAAVLWLGTWLFSRLTRDVDEMAEIKKGNVAAALVLGAVMNVLALMTSPGLQMALDGILPVPTLARDEVQAPA
jgi:uncharacterized protein DUF350